MSKRSQKQPTPRRIPLASSATLKVQAKFQNAVALYQSGRLIEAVRICQKILKVAPDHFEATHLLAVLLIQRHRFIEGERLIARALEINPNSPVALNNHGGALQNLQRMEEALSCFDKAIVLRPNYADAFNNRGVTLSQLKRFDEALESYEEAIVLKPNYAEAFNNRGIVLKELKRFDDALMSIDKAITLNPVYAEACYNRGNVLADMNCFDQALASYDQAITLKPDYAEAFSDRGSVLAELKRFDEALADYDKAITLRPNFAETLNNRGVALKELNRLDDALTSFDRAITLNPNYSEAFHNRGNIFRELKRFEEALADYEHALTINPDHPHAFSGTVDSALKICDWARTASLVRKIESYVAEGESVVQPFSLLGYSGDAALYLKCAQNYVDDKITTPPQPLWNGEIRHHDKIKVAYLSGDFRDHPLAYLTAELFELHDRNRFEILGISFGPNDRSEIRSRISGSFDQFHDVRSKTDRDIAKLLNDLEVDIAVHLTGYTTHSRPGIAAFCPVPIQVSYLGYPGTMGTKCIDYVIADKMVLPFDQQQYWTEKIIHLPDSCWVTDSKSPISPRVFTRGEVGLPDNGFVFCCFNNNYKITAPVFEVWMRLLGTVDRSVLWLFRDNDGAEKNLRKEADARGIDPARLVFASRKPLEEHLARHRLGDLFLDTLPVNAHTTACDALWAGLPLLTCYGDSFAGRVAASLLHAVGLPELVTPNLKEYEALALKLATNASFLQEIKQKLEQNRMNYPLFNTNRARQNIEEAYTTAWQIWRRGESPRSFSVEPHYAL
jgi:protein O-GlcNAc transferase